MNRKSQLLGMPHGTAANKLRKMILFQQLLKHNENLCFRCGEEIRTPKELSIEHKKSWQSAEGPRDSFFDLDNIAFSHLSCNCANGTRPERELPIRHGTSHGYQRHACRCDSCKNWQSGRMKKYKG